MQLHNILITNSTPLPPSTGALQNNSEPELEGKDITTRLTEYLKANEIPKGTGINLILDQANIRYQYFRLPHISARKIRQVLQFELEDTLLKESENYVYSHSTQSFRDSGTTDAGVYLMEKDLLDELVLIFKKFNLELRGVASLENLMDLALREKSPQGNRIHIEIGDRGKSARIFIYRNGALIGLSSLSTIQVVADNTEETVCQHFLDQINQKINAIRLAEIDIKDLFVHGKPSDRIRITEQQELIINDDYRQKQGFENGDPVENLLETRLDHPRRINLIKSNTIVVQELKKHTRSLIVTASIFFLGLVLYITATAYRGFYDKQYYDGLDKLLNQTVEKYLPKGTSKANAVYVIKERVQSLNLEKVKNNKLKGRRYQVSKTLTDLSLLKADIPSLTLVRFSLNDQSIRFQGSTTSTADFDRLQEALTRLYPSKTFHLDTNQKNRGSESVEFSTTIQFKPSR
ncbi:MAG: hypothetical protein HQ517_12035 [SAR324 cluster bacterium]|nr:hypothetical protein [SAR324 cluster bacterium]